MDQESKEGRAYLYHGVRQLSILAAAAIAAVPVWSEPPLTWRVKIAIPLFVLCMMAAAATHFVSAFVRDPEDEKDEGRLRTLGATLVMATMMLLGVGLLLAAWELALR